LSVTCPLAVGTPNVGVVATEAVKLCGADGTVAGVPSTIAPLILQDAAEVSASISSHAPVTALTRA
jgi:hypothetical protein